VDRRYYPVSVLGEGSYGIVCLCKDAKTKTKVAIKKCSFMEKFRAQVLRTLREIYILRHVDHPNLLQLKDVMPCLSKDNIDCVYIVMDSMDTNLRRIIRSRQPLENIDIQILTYQMLKGLKYMHEAGLIHRDIKPSNVLVNADLHLKLCDFGLSRGISEQENEAMTEYVVTRHYRAPEVMTNPTNYDTKIDMWGVGCILAELLGREVLFPGEDYLSQLKLIIQHVGIPSKEDLDLVHKNARAYIQDLEKQTEGKKTDWAKKYPKADPKALDLLVKLLQFSPEKRISAKDALEHPWFHSMVKHDYFKELKVLSENKKLPGPLDFSWEKPRMSREELVDVLFDEIARFRPYVKTQSYFGPTSSSSSSTPAPTSTSTTSSTSSTSTVLATPSQTSTSHTPSTSIAPTPSSTGSTGIPGTTTTSYTSNS
jgi:serine/threonine protein kinase